MSDFRLKVFRSVAKNLSFTKASQELFVSQPAITKHIQELEAAYQTRLFDRQGSRISLTESGHLLLEHCERILEDYKRLEYEMHLLHNEYTGGLKLGASTTIAQYVLPPLLASFIGKFPQVSLSLLNGNSREIEAALQEHRIDLGFVEGVFRLPNIRYTTFLEDELGLSSFLAGIIFYTREVLLTSHYEKRLFEHASQPRVACADIRLLSYLWSRTNLSRDSYQSG